jgi:hypothetical protein
MAYPFSSFLDKTAQNTGIQTRSATLNSIYVISLSGGFPQELPDGFPRIRGNHPTPLALITPTTYGPLFCALEHNPDRNPDSNPIPRDSHIQSYDFQPMNDVKDEGL